MHDLNENSVRMISQWTPPASIEILLRQLTKGQIFADKGHKDISNG